MLILEEWYCSFCSLVFYVQLHGQVERCPNCGSTDEISRNRIIDVEEKGNH